MYSKLQNLTATHHSSLPMFFLSLVTVLTRLCLLRHKTLQPPPLGFMPLSSIVISTRSLPWTFTKLNFLHQMTPYNSSEVPDTSPPDTPTHAHTPMQTASSLQTKYFALNLPSANAWWLPIILFFNFIQFIFFLFFFLRSQWISFFFSFSSHFAVFFLFSLSYFYTSTRLFPSILSILFPPFFLYSFLFPVHFFLFFHSRKLPFLASVFFLLHFFYFYFFIWYL